MSRWKARLGAALAGMAERLNGAPALSQALPQQPERDHPIHPWAYPQEIIDAVCADHASGASIGECARKYGIGVATASRYVNGQYRKRPPGLIRRGYRVRHGSRPRPG